MFNIPKEAGHRGEAYACLPTERSLQLLLRLLSESTAGWGTSEGDALLYHKPPRGNS